MKKSISIVLLATILLQSCVAYQKTSVSLNEATDRGKVLLIDTHGSAYHLQNIEMEDSVYYGFIAKERTVLYEAQFSGIYLQDNKRSKTQTVIVVVGLVVIIGVLVVAAFAAMFNELNKL
jgi:hypothetical protein